MMLTIKCRYIKKCYLVVLSELLCNTVSIGSTHYQFDYDVEGNVTQIIKNKTTYQSYYYNTLNQLVSVVNQKDLNVFIYSYDSKGQRHFKKVLSNGDTIYFYYGQKGKLLNEALSLTGEKAKRSSYFAGNRFIRNISDQNDSTLQTPLAIRKNNPLSVDLSAGVSTKESVHLDDYGLQSDENSQVNQSLPSGDKHPRMGAYEEDDFNFDRNPFIYGTGYYDSESGLNFQRARYYNPATQSFMAQDSKDLVNRYNYANSNPVMNYDPSGHNALSLAVPLGIAAIGEFGIMSTISIANPFTAVVAGFIIGGVSGGAAEASQEYFNHESANATRIVGFTWVGIILGGAQAANLQYAKALEIENFIFSKNKLKGNTIDEFPTAIGDKNLLIASSPSNKTTTALEQNSVVESEGVFIMDGEADVPVPEGVLKPEAASEVVNTENVINPPPKISPLSHGTTPPTVINESLKESITVKTTQVRELTQEEINALPAQRRQRLKNAKRLDNQVVTRVENSAPDQMPHQEGDLQFNLEF